MHAVEQRLIHHREAAVATNYHVGGGHLQQQREQCFCFGDAIESAVVAQVSAAGVAVVALQHAVQSVGEIELFAARLAARQIKRQAAGRRPIPITWKTTE